MKYLIPVGLAGFAVLDLLQMWFRRFDVDYQEGNLLPTRWIAWGTCRALSRRHAQDYRYFYVKLPFISQWKFDPCRFEDGWHSPMFFQFAGRSGWTWYRA
jgi:hypothetical protein